MLVKLQTLYQLAANPIPVRLQTLPQLRSKPCTSQAANPIPGKIGLFILSGAYIPVGIQAVLKVSVFDKQKNQIRTEKTRQLLLPQ